MAQENKIESVKIQGFRSLADVELNDLPNAAVLIGPNGSGKSNFMRFFEMLSWMLESPCRLGEFVARHGGADDQLFGGNARTPRMNAEISIKAATGTDSYKFTLAHSYPDRFFFSEEAFRYQGSHDHVYRDWQHLDSGHREANLVLAGQTPDFVPRINQNMARVVVHLLRRCAVFQFSRYLREFQDEGQLRHY